MSTWIGAILQSPQNHEMCDTHTYTQGHESGGAWHPSAIFPSYFGGKLHKNNQIQAIIMRRNNADDEDDERSKILSME